MTQRTIPFEPMTESRAERLQRLLSGELGHHVRPAAELTFTPEREAEARRLARTFTGRRTTSQNGGPK